MRRATLLVALVFPLLARADTTSAGGGRARREPVLHERIPNLSDREVATLVSVDGDTPVALVYEGQVLEAPDEGAALGEDERAIPALPEVPGAGPAAPTFRPDRQTSLDQRVGYYEVFTPGISPFKRVTALDAIRIAADGVPTLTVADEAPADVPVIGVGVDEPGRTRFWGSVVLDFRGGHRVPLPSVAPEARLLSARTEPEVAIRFERDSADNFFAIVDAPPPSPVRLTFLTDAPKSYFNAELPSVPTDVLASHVAPMPPPLRRSAIAFARELGIERGDPLPFALSALVEHFRSFEEGERPPVDSGDIYLDLARGGVGVCRHRAYAFVITAHALGIPARYVQNEAHAWVEVELGEVGFMRIDLGGSAAGFEAHGLRDRPMYRPERPDPLPRPPAYERAIAEASRNADPRDGASSGGGRSAGSASGASGSASRAASESASDSASASESESASESASDSESASASESAARLPLRVDVERRVRQAYRGRSLDLRGQIVGPDGEGVPGLRVEIVLDADAPALLGVTVTRDGGWFAGTFGVPVELGVGEYVLRVRTPGNDAFAPAEAR